MNTEGRLTEKRFSKSAESAQSVDESEVRTDRPPKHPTVHWSVQWRVWWSVGRSGRGWGQIPAFAIGGDHGTIPDSTSRSKGLGYSVGNSRRPATPGSLGAASSERRPRGTGRLAQVSVMLDSRFLTRSSIRNVGGASCRVPRCRGQRVASCQSASGRCKAPP
jgi:hypothetical protein